MLLLLLLALRYKCHGFNSDLICASVFDRQDERNERKKCARMYLSL